MLTHERLKEVLDYNPEIGFFIWRKNITDNPRIGTLAGRGFKSHPYCKIQIDKKQYYAHRLAWFYIYGKWPEKDIDHIDLNKRNNRFFNLREATVPQNAFNQKARNPTGIKGISYCKRKHHWRATIKVNGKSIWLGGHATPEIAGEIYRKAAEMLQGEYAVSKHG